MFKTVLGGKGKEMCINVVNGFNEVNVVNEASPWYL
jgi:hypothetical protein